MNAKLTTKTKLMKACEEAYAPDFDNCSGFLRSVCSTLNVIIDQGDADSIIDFLEDNWDELNGPSEAKAAVDDGKFVVAALKSSDSNKVPKPTHGHVAVVVPGGLYHNTYPRAYCGGMSPLGRSTGDKSVGEVWATVDRDEVSYYQSKIAPLGLGDPA